QSLTQLLEDVRNGPYPASEDAGVEEGITPDNAVYNTDPELPWDRISRNLDQLEKENTMMRLLGEILTSSKRSWSRSKKGNFRSCFGVRLERIGSTSGLGC
ncbi:ANFC protein, partial [Amia calva]|nr:ANFC protein [Amia calva]